MKKTKKKLKVLSKKDKKGVKGGNYWGGNGNGGNGNGNGHGNGGNNCGGGGDGWWSWFCPPPEPGDE